MTKSKLLTIFAVIILFAFIPVYLFRKSIQFDEVLFVNEWLKLVSSGVIIAFIFFLLTSYYESNRKKESDRRLLKMIIEILTNLHKMVVEKRKNDIILFEQDIRKLPNISYLFHDHKLKLSVEALIDAEFIERIKEYLDSNMSNGDHKYMKGSIEDQIKKITALL